MPTIPRDESLLLKEVFLTAHNQKWPLPALKATQTQRVTFSFHIFPITFGSLYPFHHAPLSWPIHVNLLSAWPGLSCVFTSLILSITWTFVPLLPESFTCENLMDFCLFY